MNKLLRPRVVIPVVLSVALLAGLLGFADVKKVLRLMSGFQHIYLLYFLLLTMVYEAVRCLQWHLLLEALGVRVPLRAQVFTFLGGETTKSLPIGNYFQNYLLKVAEGTDFARSSAATTLIVLIEVAVCLAGVVVLGIDGWTWLRPLIVGGVAVCALLAWLAVRLHRHGVVPAWLTTHAWVRVAMREFQQFRAGAAALWHPRILACAGGLGAVYTFTAAAAFYVVGRGLGVGGLSFGEAVAVYCFSLAFGLIFPLPVDIGVNEASGVAALLAVGVEKSDAVSLVLVNRVLSVGAALAIVVLSLAVLHDEFRSVLRGGHDEGASGDSRGGSLATTGDG
jgi:uncharacterized membrane protein YbhN (UPF0104 family)